MGISGSSVLLLSQAQRSVILAFFCLIPCTYSVHWQILLVLPQNVSKHDSCFPHPPSSPALPPLLWAAVMSPYSCACFHSCCSPVSELCSLRGDWSKCFQTFHSSAQKASSAIQPCRDCVKRRAVALCLPASRPVPPLCPVHTSPATGRVSLPQTPQAHFRLRALALPAPGLHGPSSGPESESAHCSLSLGLCFCLVSERLFLNPKLKQRTFIHTVSLFVPLPACLSYKVFTTYL